MDPRDVRGVSLVTVDLVVETTWDVDVEEDPKDKTFMSELTHKGVEW